MVVLQVDAKCSRSDGDRLLMKARSFSIAEFLPVGNYKSIPEGHLPPSKISMKWTYG
ncbi:hypothetical protein DR64_774 [Paraburkholderia xenovorans LB400]|nr:hypothetical protein DR64_774 [Paraburkholderia xenovorans LB400]